MEHTSLICLGFGALIFLIAEVLIPRRAQTGREALPMLYGVFLGFAALAYLIGHIKIILIDDQGVTACPGSYTIRRATIPWSQIACCELVVHRDTFGKIAVAYPRFRGHDGKDLFPGLGWALSMASPQDQQKVLQSLKRRFPKLDSDPWEL
jgi:hypothetical protein